MVMVSFVLTPKLPIPAKDIHPEAWFTVQRSLVIINHKVSHHIVAIIVQQHLVLLSTFEPRFVSVKYRIVWHYPDLVKSNSSLFISRKLVRILASAIEMDFSCFQIICCLKGFHKIFWIKNFSNFLYIFNFCKRASCNNVLVRQVVKNTFFRKLSS